MSYQVLARKWRPRTFHEMVGQEHVLKALINALDNDRLHHAYLFTGTRGIGKTTIARILAKCLNCETGISSRPCGECAACCEIDDGRFVDLIEVDAASRTKVEDTRELLDNVQYAPTRGRYKVYLVDEVHMLSTHSFNALLKTLEEPPPHVKFLLATTDPQKLPVTILSRCLQFNLKNMPPERIVGHLHKVLEAEQIPFEEAALWQLGRSADGSMRDAMSLTDQAIAFGEGRVCEADVSAMLGSIDRGQVYQLLHALAANDAAALLQAVATLAEQAPDFMAVLADLLSLLHRVAIAQAVPDAVENSLGDREQVLALAGQLPAEDVQLFYQIALQGRRDLPLAPDARNGLEMTLLRMLAFRPQGVPQPPQQPLAQTSVPEASPQQSAPVTAPTAPPTVPAAPGQSAPPMEPPVKKKQIEPLAEQPSSPQPPVTEPAATTLSASPEKPARGVAHSPAQAALAAVRGDAASVPASQPVPAQQEPAVQPTPEPVTEAAVEQPAPMPDTPAETKPAAATEPSATDRLELEVSDETPVLAEMRPEHWLSLQPRIPVGGMTQNLLSNAAWLESGTDSVRLLLDADHFRLYNANHEQRINEAFTKVFGHTVRVHLEEGTPQQETPAQYRQRKREERQQQAVEAIHNDPNIQSLVHTFGATIDPDSVKPID